MSDELEEVKPDPDAEALAKSRLPDPISPSEREVFVARIKELEMEREELRKQIEKANAPSRLPKKESMLKKFCPL